MIWKKLDMIDLVYMNETKQKAQDTIRKPCESLKSSSPLKKKNHGSSRTDFHKKMDSDAAETSPLLFINSYGKGQRSWYAEIKF